MFFAHEKTSDLFGLLYVLSYLCNMKRKTILFLLTITIALFSACTVNDDDDDQVEHKQITDSFDEPAAVVANRVFSATKVTDSLFNVCETAADLEQFAEQIQQIEGLDYVEFDAQGMTIKMKNFLPIHYIYPLYDETQDELELMVNETAASAQRMTRALDTRQAHESNEMQTLCIVDQLSHDEGFSYVTSYVNDLEKKAKSLGMSVKVLRNSVEPYFFRNEMFDYDMLLVLSHGGYSNGVHSVVTSWDFGTNLTEEEIEELYEQFQHDAENPLNPNYFVLGNVKERHTRGNRQVEENHCYLAVTDTYISEGEYDYPEVRNGKAVVFSASCMALKGNNYMANAFLNKGAACYIGYTESQSVGVRGGHNFFVSLLQGLTLDEAFNDIPTNLKIYTKNNARLVSCFNNRVKNAKNICARCVTTEDADVVEFDNSVPNIFGEEEQGIAILTGTARMLYSFDNTYGFFFGKEADLSDGEKLVEFQFDMFGKSQDARLSYDDKKDIVTFHYVFEDGSLLDGEEYYFCAYMQDKHGHYCYGEIKKLEATGLIKGELGLFELKGPVKSCTLRIGSDTETTTRTFDRNGFWLTYDGQSIKSIYNGGITRDELGRIIEGRFDEGFESFEYDARGRIVKYGYLYYDGGNGITYYYGGDGVLEKAVDEPWGMDAEYYGTDVYYYKDYVFDDYGNWIRRLSYTNYSGATETRTIEYYDTKK